MIQSGANKPQKSMPFRNMASMIVAGGDGEHPAKEHFKEGGFQGVLTKPFTSEELERTLHRALYNSMEGA